MHLESWDLISVSHTDCTHANPVNHSLICQWKWNVVSCLMHPLFSCICYHIAIERLGMCVGVCCLGWECLHSGFGWMNMHMCAQCAHVCVAVLAHHVQL